MSLIRTGLVIGAVIYMMPSDTKRQTELIHSASDTLVWGLTYCEREPATCDQAKATWQQVMIKAKFGAALASDLAGKWSESRGARPANAEVAPDNGAMARLIDTSQSDPQHGAADFSLPATRG